MQDPEIEIKDRRQFERWNTSIPCKVLWGEWIISGEIANISYQGALIAVPSAIPPVDSAVTLVFHYECQVLLTAKVDSQVVHTSEQAVDAGGAGGFGLAFNEPVGEVLPKLQPLIEKLSANSR